MRKSQILAIVVFALLTAIAVIGGFASKAMIEQAAVVTASSAQTALTGAYATVAVTQRPNLMELGILAAIGLLVSRLRWKATDRS